MFDLLVDESLHPLAQGRNHGQTDFVCCNVKVQEVLINDRDCYRVSFLLFANDVLLVAAMGEDEFQPSLKSAFL